jgi:hypothetical protein
MRTEILGPSAKGSIFRAIKTFSIIVAMASFPATVEAAALTMDGTGTTRQGLATCEREGLEDARRKALARHIAELTGRFDAARHESLLSRAESFVSRERIRRVSPAGAGFCSVTASFRFSDRKVREALKSSSSGLARVGVVTRYYVDGELAENTGYNPLEVVNAIQSELAHYNCRLGDMLYEQDEFSQRMQEQMVALSGNTDEPEKVYKSGVSHAEAVRNALTAVREDLQRSIGLGQEGFRRVVSGEISARHQGPDPDSENQIVSALVTLTMHDVITNTPLRPTYPIPLRGLGPDRTSARVLAVNAGIESAIAALNQQSPICGD